MKIRFHINYKTTPGQNILVCGAPEVLGNWDPGNALPMNYAFNGEWSAEIEVPENHPGFEYKYLLKDDQGHEIWEWGAPRKLTSVRLTAPLVILQENWCSPSGEEKVMYSSAFHHAVMRPGEGFTSPDSKAKKVMQFRIRVPRISSQYRVCVLGNQEKLGNWDRTKPLLLGTGNDFPEWSGAVSLQGMKVPVEYKYGIYDSRSGETVTLEEGENRHILRLPENEESFRLVRSDESFRYPLGNWKGAGVSVPVFSLRSKRGFGIGDFTDLKEFIDWASGVGMKMVQILPVNETIASHNSHALSFGDVKGTVDAHIYGRR